MSKQMSVCTNDTPQLDVYHLSARKREITLKDVSNVISTLNSKILELKNEIVSLRRSDSNTNRNQQLVHRSSPLNLQYLGNEINKHENHDSLKTHRSLKPYSISEKIEENGISKMLECMCNNENILKKNIHCDCILKNTTKRKIKKISRGVQSYPIEKGSNKCRSFNCFKTKPKIKKQKLLQKFEENPITFDKKNVETIPDPPKEVLKMAHKDKFSKIPKEDNKHVKISEQGMLEKVSTNRGKERFARVQAFQKTDEIDAKVNESLKKEYTPSSQIQAVSEKGVNVKTNLVKKEDKIVAKEGQKEKSRLIKLFSKGRKNKSNELLKKPEPETKKDNTTKETDKLLENNPIKKMYHFSKEKIPKSFEHIAKHRRRKCICEESPGNQTILRTDNINTDNVVERLDIYIKELNDILFNVSLILRETSKHYCES